MTEGEVIDIGRQGIIVMLLVASPLLVTGLVTGVVISLFQTLTHIQEMTLTFVPKIIAVFLALILFLPFMLRKLTDFTHMIMDRAITGG